MSRARAAALAVCVVLLGARGARAQDTFDLEPPRGEIGASVDGSWFDYAGSSDLSAQLFRQWIWFRTSMWYLSPQVLRLDLDIRPTFNQSLFGGEPESPNGGGTSFVGGARLHVLSGARTSLETYVWRDDETVRARFGQRTDLDVFEWGAELDNSNPYLPFKLTYDDRTRDVIWTTGADLAPARTDNRTQVLEFTARNSKTGLQIERLVFDDFIADRDYRRTLGRFDNLFRWGKGSRLESMIQYVNRQRNAPYERFNLRGIVHLQHTARIFSDYDYQYSTQNTPVDRVTENVGRVGVTYLMSPFVDVGAEAYGQARSARVGKQSYLRVRPNVGFVANLPFRVLATTRLFAGYEWHDQSAKEDGFIERLDEPHRVGPNGRFQLDRAFAEPSSLTVTSDDGTLLYEEGIDYRSVITGPFLEVIVLPGGRIAIGDLVRVSYRFRVVPDASANAFIWGYELGLRLGGIRLYVQRSRQDSQDSVPPGVLPVLRNYDDSAVGIGVDLANRYGSISVAAEHRRQTTDVFDYTTNTLRAALGVMVRRNLEASVRGLLMAQRGTEIPLDQLLGEASLEWGLSRALRLRAYVAAWNWDFGLRKEDFLGGGVGLEWNVARLTTLVRFDRLSWENGFDRLENRLYISLTRAF